MPLTSALYNRHSEELMLEEPDLATHYGEGYGGRFRTFTGVPQPTAQDTFRASLLDEVIAGERTMKSAAKEMKLGYSFARELLARYRAQGIAGLVPQPRIEQLYERLYPVLERELQVGQELCLDAPSETELARYIKAVKQVALHLGVTLQWNGLEPVTLRIEHNPEVSAEEPWSTRRTRRFRAYLLLRARKSASGWLLGSGVATRVY